MAKVMVSFPGDFLSDVDNIAREERRSRSELLREAMRVYIEIKRGKKAAGNDPRVRAAVKVQNRLSHIAPGTGEDSTNDIRRWREIR